MRRASPPRSIFGRRGARLRTPMAPERSTSEPENAKRGVENTVAYHKDVPLALDVHRRGGLDLGSEGRLTFWGRGSARRVFSIR